MTAAQQATEAVTTAQADYDRAAAARRAALANEAKFHVDASGRIVSDNPTPNALPEANNAIEAATNAVDYTTRAIKQSVADLGVFAELNATCFPADERAKLVAAGRSTQGG